MFKRNDRKGVNLIQNRFTALLKKFLYNHMLAEKDLINISLDGKLSLGNPLKVYLLKDLYEDEVINRYSYSEKTNKIFEEWIDEWI